MILFFDAIGKLCTFQFVWDVRQHLSSIPIWRLLKYVPCLFNICFTMKGKIERQKQKNLFLMFDKYLRMILFMPICFFFGMQIYIWFFFVTRKPIQPKQIARKIFFFLSPCQNYTDEQSEIGKKEINQQHPNTFLINWLFNQKGKEKVREKLKFYLD